MWVILFGSNMKGMEWNHFMIILLLDPYFKIKNWIYRGILGILLKKSLNLIPFPHIPPNFGGIKIWGFKGIEEYFKMILSIPFYSLHPNETIKISYDFWVLSQDPNYFLHSTLNINKHSTSAQTSFAPSCIR